MMKLKESRMSNEAITFLIIDDDDVDYMAIKRALKQLKIKNPIVRARDGFEGISLLHTESGSTDLASSCIVLLDLNMPKMGGMEFLENLRSHEDTKNTPVYITTTSTSDQDIRQAYKYNITQYLVKSDLLESLREAMGYLDSYKMITGGQLSYEETSLSA